MELGGREWNPLTGKDTESNGKTWNRKEGVYRRSFPFPFPGCFSPKCPISTHTENMARFTNLFFIHMHVCGVQVHVCTSECGNQKLTLGVGVSLNWGLTNLARMVAS